MHQLSDLPIGKSALGNLILGSKEFKTGGSAGSVTRKCQSSSTVFNDRPLLVIDTPGWCDTQLSQEKVTNELVRSYYKIAPGPHAFLIVTWGRHTTEAEDTLTFLEHLFGESIVDYCIVVITHEDDLKYDGQTLGEYLAGSTTSFRSFIDRCGGRCIAVNSKTKNNDERTTKLTELLNYIDSISEKQQKPFYTHELFEKAAQDEAQRRAKNEK